MVLAFTHESTAGEDAELIIELLDEDIAGVGVAGVPTAEKFDRFVRGVHGSTARRRASPSGIACSYLLEDITVPQAVRVW
jgi:hypothetical protein